MDMTHSFAVWAGAQWSLSHRRLGTEPLPMMINRVRRYFLIDQSNRSANGRTRRGVSAFALFLVGTTGYLLAAR